MAVGADQLTLRYLVQDGLAPETASQKLAYLARLDRPGKVIPVHRGVMEDSAAIRAGHRGLQLAVPGDSVCDALLASPKSLVTRHSPVLSVVLASAALAPGLAARSSFVKLIHVLGQATSSTTPVHVASIDTEPDDPDATYEANL